METETVGTVTFGTHEAFRDAVADVGEASGDVVMALVLAVAAGALAVIRGILGAAELALRGFQRSLEYAADVFEELAADPDEASP